MSLCDGWCVTDDVQYLEPLEDLSNVWRSYDSLCLLEQLWLMLHMRSLLCICYGWYGVLQSTFSKPFLKHHVQNPFPFMSFIIIMLILWYLQAEA